MESGIAQRVFQERKIGYAITDAELKIIQVEGNRAMLSPDLQSWLGNSLLEVVPELLGSEEVLKSILAGDLPRFQLEWVNREAPDGHTLYLTMVELPYADGDGEITGILHLVQDATETGLLEQQVTQRRNELRLLRDELARHNLELAAANAELRRLDDLKSAFVSIAAHELRTPLTSIRGFAEMLMDGSAGPLTEKQRAYLATVQESSDRLVAIADNLLDITRIESGKIELSLRPTELRQLLETAVAELRPQLEERSQTISIEADEGLPPALCDPVRCKQILDNLLMNAIKYSAEGDAISAEIGSSDEEGFLQLSVVDTGVGIPFEDQEKLFNRFFRASTATLTQASGAGLGLHIVRSLVDLHGGRIWFESEPGLGSTFHVTLPIAEDPDESDE